MFNNLYNNQLINQSRSLFFIYSDSF